MTAYYACVNNDNGELRIVSGTGMCRSYESEISWNNVGPQGPQGIQGPSGITASFDTFVRPDQDNSWGIASDGEPWSTFNTSQTSYSNLYIISNQGVIKYGYNIPAYPRLGLTEFFDCEAFVHVASMVVSTYSRSGVYLRGQTIYPYPDPSDLGEPNSLYRCDIYTYPSGSSTISSLEILNGRNMITDVNLPFDATTTPYSMRFRAIDSNLFAKVWPDGSLEPSSWTLTCTDINIINAGYFGAYGELTGSSDKVAFDYFKATLL